MTPSQKNEKALAALREIGYAMRMTTAFDKLQDMAKEAIATLSQPTTGEMAGFKQIGWTWKTGSDPFLWTEFREMKDLSIQKAEELKAEAVYRKVLDPTVGGEVVTAALGKTTSASGRGFRCGSMFGSEYLVDIPEGTPIHALIQSRVGGSLDD